MIRWEKARRDVLTASLECLPVKGQPPRLPSVKHLYLFVGEPRTGKTTLAFLADFSTFACHVDTDAFRKEDLCDSVREKLSDFYGHGLHRVCIMTFGLHRRSFPDVHAQIILHLPPDVLVTICHFERHSTKPLASPLRSGMKYRA